MQSETLSSVQPQSDAHELPDVLYIGFQKTGSTFLRGYLKNLGSVRLTRGGIVLQSGFKIGPEILKERYIAEMREKTLAQSPDAQVHVDMYEGLIGYYFKSSDHWDPAHMMSRTALQESTIEYNPRKFVRFLSEILPPDRRILVTIRNQITFIDSNYRHFRDHFDRSYNLVNFMRSIEGRLICAAANYDRMIEPLLEMFGPERVLVLPLEKVHADEDSALNSVAKFIGVPHKEYRTEREKNEGVNYARVPQRKKVLGLPIGPKPAESPMLPKPSEEQVEFIKAMYAASNALLSDLIGEDLRKYGYAA